MASQKVLYLEAKQGAFTVGTRDIQKPGPGELLVKVKASGVNPVEWKIQTLGIILEKYPAILGADVAGDVEAIGEDVQGFSVGDKVVLQTNFADNDYAGYQQFTKVPAEIVAKIPDNISYTQAASIPSGLATASIGLLSSGGAGLNPSFDKSVQSTGPAVVIGGSSAVGAFAIQVLKFSGFSPIITYASGHHADYLKSLGATHVVDRKTVAVADLPSEVKKIANGPVKTVFDAVSGPDTQEAGYETLAEGGGIVVVLSKSIKNVVDSKKIYEPFGVVHAPFNREFGAKVFSQLTQLLSDGTFVPHNTEEVPGGLAAVSEALERLKTNQVSGKKLIVLPQETK
ncbi:hypothetical protein PM082_020645 [Marasmius tenuissimus]|nr:hypothetical protein PM082_020645 [Marasmius tenuissimus]